MDGYISDHECDRYREDGGGCRLCDTLTSIQTEVKQRAEAAKKQNDVDTNRARQIRNQINADSGDWQGDFNRAMSYASPQLQRQWVDAITQTTKACKRSFAATHPLGLAEAYRNREECLKKEEARKLSERCSDNDR